MLLTDKFEYMFLYDFSTVISSYTHSVKLEYLTQQTIYLHIMCLSSFLVQYEYYSAVKVKTLKVIDSLSRNEK